MGYNIQAKRTVFNGIEYASQMEARMAKVLTDNLVDFLYSVWVQVQMDGEQRFKEIDFFFQRPIKPIWCPQFINCLETKGVLQPSDYERMKALESEGLKTFIVTPSILDYWEQYKFLSHRLGKVKKKRTKDNNEIDF